MKNRLSIVLVIAVFQAAALASTSSAIELFGGRLHEVKGSIQQTLNYRTHQDERGVKFSSFRTTFRGEGLLDIITQSSWNLKLYGLFNFWYDNGTNIDRNLGHAIALESGSFGLRSYRRSNQQEEIMKDLYFEYTWSDVFEARLGKQMVSWGETAEARVADVINPLDYSNLVAFPDWEDYKIGLWMGRFFYTPRNIWQDISFELIIIPPDFQYNRFSPAGSGQYFGATPQGLTMEFPLRTLYWPEYFSRVFHKQREDAPTNDASNIETGLRIRGVTFGTDWTISTFYTRLDSPIYNGAQGYANSQQMVLNKAIGEFGLPIPKKNVGQVFIYPHYLSSAFTFSKPIDWAKSVIRGEVVLNSNKEYNWFSSDFKECKTLTRDLLTTALTLDRKNMVPYLSLWNNSRAVSTTLTWYHYKLFGHERGIAWEAGVPGYMESTWDKLSVQIDTGFYHDTIVPALNFLYDCNGNTTVSGALRFAPGDHWRWMVVYQQINESRNAAGKDIGRYQDQVIFSMRYEF
ncbi:MAG: hypothetical protein NT096_02325 [Proteobacteria bacterium]|nr:hypothetical protein [Pseudomonadota bacterium]